MRNGANIWGCAYEKFDHLNENDCKDFLLPDLFQMILLVNGRPFKGEGSVGSYNK